MGPHALGLPAGVVSRGRPLLQGFSCCGAWASTVVACRLSSWFVESSRPGMESMSPGLVGRFFSIVPPGKSILSLFFGRCLWSTNVLSFDEIGALSVPALCEPRLRGQVWKQESSCSRGRRVVQVRGCWLQRGRGHRAGEKGPAGGSWQAELVDHGQGLLQCEGSWMLDFSLGNSVSCLPPAVELLPFLVVLGR